MLIISYNKKGAYIYGKTFAVLLKTVKMLKFNPANLSPFTVLHHIFYSEMCLLFSGYQVALTALQRKNNSVLLIKLLKLMASVYSYTSYTYTHSNIQINVHNMLN